MKGLSIESGKHSRYKESEADSLGLVLIRNAKYDVTNAPKVLLKLDKVDELFTSNKLYTLKDYFENAPIDLSFFNVKPKYNGLSSKNVTMNADKDLDSIKTHPDCIKRYETLAGKGNAVTLNCCSALNNTLPQYKENALLEIVRYLYENKAIGLCAHLCIFALKNNYDAAVYNGFLSLCFSRLYYNDKKLERFNAANAYAKRETNLKELQDFLFEVNSADLDKLAGYFLSLKTDKLSLNNLTIAVDAGHGGSNTGAGGPTGSSEKELTLAISLKLQKTLEQQGAKVIMTRTTEKFVDNKDRILFYRDSTPDLLISIHLNSASDPIRVTGTSTYYRYIGFRGLSRSIYKRMLELGLKEYGNTGSFNFMLNSPIEYPNALVETVFLSNPEDEMKILDEGFQQQIADKIVLGIKDFLENCKGNK